MEIASQRKSAASFVVVVGGVERDVGDGIQRGSEGALERDIEVGGAILGLWEDFGILLDWLLV